jgi:type I restriction enzyme R subunit
MLPYSAKFVTSTNGRSPSKYIETGVEELDQEKLPHLLELKYHAVSDGAAKLGGVSRVRKLFINFQKYLYEGKVVA